MIGLERFSRGFSVGRRFWPQVAEHRRALGVVAGVSLVSTAFELLRPWPIQWIVDGALAPQGEPTQSASFVIAVGATALLVFMLGRAALEYWGTLKLTEIGHAVTRSLRLRIFSHLAELSPAFHARHKSGDLLMRLMGDAPMVRTMLVDSAVHLATRLVLIVSTVGIMLWMDWLLTAVVLTLVPVLVFIVRLLSRQLTIAVRKQRRKEGELADFLHEAIGATTLIQSLGRSTDTVRRFARSNRRNARAGLKAAKAEARLSTSVDMLLGVTVAATLAFGSWRVVGGHLMLGELLVFLSYVRSLLKPVRSASKQQARVAKGVACGERILAVLDESQAIRATSGDVPAPAEPKLLVFQDVSFQYPDGARALAGIDVTFRRGELTALFGPSGAGKSTLASLALRIFDPTDGTIRLDQDDVRELDVDSVRERFGLSMQNTVLFGESVRENLFLGQPDASDEELFAALDAAGAKEFVDATEGGLDTVLGSGGVGFSGGQSKRLCLARAFLRRAPILIVDEPFAGLDVENADRVAASLAAFARDHVVVVITHEVERLSAFDRVVFIDGGRVRGAGTHEELIAADARYARCCRPHAQGVG